MEQCAIGSLKKFHYKKKYTGSDIGTRIVYMDKEDIKAFFDTSGKMQDIKLHHIQLRKTTGCLVVSFKRLGITLFLF